MATNQTETSFEELVDMLARNILKEPCDMQAQRRYDELGEAFLKEDEEVRYDTIKSTFKGNDGTEHSFSFLRTTRTSYARLGKSQIPLVREAKAYEWE